MDMTEAALADALRRKIDSKTKPLGALGRIEALALQIGLVTGSLAPDMARCRLTIFAADHGVAAAGVSAYPQAVTRQMVLNFLAGGAAANVFARSTGAEIAVVDAGVAGPPLEMDGLIDRRIAPGTADFTAGPAMTAVQRDRALALGREIGAEPGCDAAAFGEMGIANTSAATLLAHKLIGQPLAALVGPGTGLDAQGLVAKRDVLGRAAARTPDRLDPLEALAEYGGFEIAMMAGAMQGAAETGRLVLVDGFIAGAAALVAAAETPAARHAMVFAHRSAEPGHAAVLDALQAEPLLDLGLRLGEGTGALLAWPLVRAAADMLRDMASFADAGVSGPA
ncbi:MAG: nicotinate-nucleotide--dimethylbenzimidazole phosphoribosyltransferase [Pseudomonadota bacterium]